MLQGKKNLEAYCQRKNPVLESNENKKKTMTNYKLNTIGRDSDRSRKK